MQRRAEQAAAKGARGAGRAGPQRLEIGCPVPATIRCGPLVPRRVGAEAPENGLLNSAVRPHSVMPNGWRSQAASASSLDGTFPVFIFRQP